MVEALASGMPVLGLARGGAVDIVRPGADGVLIDEAEVADIRRGVRALAEGDWDRPALVHRSHLFARPRFRSRDVGPREGHHVLGIVTMTGPEATAGFSWRRAAERIGSVVCVAVADMDAQLWTNSQQLMTRLGSAIPVVYVESLGLRAPRLSRRDISRLGRRLRRGIAQVPQRPDGLVVVSPLVIPYHGRRTLQELNRHLLDRQLRASLVGLPRPRVLWSYTPIAAAELDLAGFDLVVYHCVDDFGTVPRMPAAAVYEAERELAARADVVFASAPALATRLREINPRTILVPNVADTAHFATALEDGDVPDEIARLPRPRVLYVGSLSDHKIDWSLLADVSASLPEFSFVFVGPSAASHV